MGRYNDLIRRGLYQYDKEALFELGEMYRDGDGVKQNLEEAGKWFTKAKQLGHPKAEEAITALHAPEPETKPETETDSESVQKEQPLLFVEDEQDEEKELLTTKEDQSTNRPYCPRGHGQVRSWSGGMRCWTCGWTPGGGTTPQTIEKPKEEEPKSYSMGGCCGFIIVALILWNACEEFL